MEAFKAGLSRYRRREWATAARCFRDALGANPKDGPSRIYLDRCEIFSRRAAGPGLGRRVAEQTLASIDMELSKFRSTSCNSACMSEARSAMDGNPVRVSGLHSEEREADRRDEKYCSQRVRRSGEGGSVRSGGHAGGTAASIRGTTVYKESASLDAELPRARSAIAETTSVLRQISRDVQVGRGRRRQGTGGGVGYYRKRGAQPGRGDPAGAIAGEKRRDLQPGDPCIGDDEHLSAAFCNCRGRASSSSACSVCSRTRASSSFRPRCSEKRGAPHRGGNDLYQTHVDHSVEILNKTPGLPNDLPGLASLHHEHFDGSGYPRGLRGVAMPLPGMIAAIVDAFDTLVAPPPAGQAHVALRTRSTSFSRGAAASFSPALVEQFIQCVGVYPVGSAVELNSGEVGIVIAQNPLRRLQPACHGSQGCEGDRKPTLQDARSVQESRSARRTKSTGFATRWNTTR